MTGRILLTGGCGFIGANLAAKALENGLSSLAIVDDLSRRGSDANRQWLSAKGQFDFFRVDVTNRAALSEVVRKFDPTLVFHLAGQVAMTTSLLDPVRDFEINTLGTVNLLEVLRLHCKDAALVFSSTNKVYGDLEHLLYSDSGSRYVAVHYPKGFAENLPIDLRSPYGCSKGAADQYVLEYARSFGLRATVLRHSSVFGLRQFSTEDQGWIGWFISEALRLKDRIAPPHITIAGDGKQVRDILFADDAVACYIAAAHAIDRTSGNAYNIGGGMENSVSLIELFETLQGMLGISIKIQRQPARPNDQKVFVADYSRAYRDFGWKPKTGKLDGLRSMIEWISSQRARGWNSQ